MTDDGIAMEKLFEAFRARTYPDVDGHPTIGYGHLIVEGDEFPDRPMTESEADTLLRRDIETHEWAMLELVSVPLRDYERDALASFVFNVGSKAFKTSTLRNYVNGGATQAAADQFVRWVYATPRRNLWGRVINSRADKKRVLGLARRRNAEAARFLGAGFVLVTSIYRGGAA